MFHRPEYTKRVPQEGMPLSKSPDERGELIISFNIQFPRKLSMEKKSLIQQALS